MNIFSFIKQAQQDYETRYVTIQDGLEHNLKHTIRLCDLYYNSKFETGQTDPITGKEKPFQNMVRSRTHLAVRATDDGGFMQVKPKRNRSDRKAQALLLNARDAEWRDEAEFDAYRRKLRFTRAKYGGAVSKWAKDDGVMKPSVVEWNNLIVDQEDLLANPIIERHKYTPAEIMASDFDNKMEAIETAKKTSSSSAENKDPAQNESLGSFVEVFEVSGLFPEDMYKEDGDANTYLRMKFLVVMDKSSDKTPNGIVLYKGLQKDNPYDYLPWVEQQGRALGIGIIEMLFEPQVWTNYTRLAERDMLDIARLVLFQTDDPNFNTANVITDVYTGSVLKTAQGRSVTQVNSTPTSFPAFETFFSQWESIADKEANSFDALTGEDTNAGDPYKKTKLLNSAAGSEFKLRRKEERDFIRSLYRRRVLPHHIKNLDTREEIEAVCSDDELSFVDTVLQVEEQNDKVRSFMGGKGKPEALTEQSSPVQSRNRKVTDVKGIVKPEHITDMDVIVGSENDMESELLLLERFFAAFGQAITNPQIMQNPIAASLLTKASEAAGLAGAGSEPTKLAASPISQETANV